MAAFRWRLIPACVAALVLSGCGLLCDRYCAREHERCGHYYAPPQQGCCPTSGYYPPQPAQANYPRPAECQPVPYCQ
ncbi:MAG: hypothetical protein ACJ8C4_06200 [Gemmataceae bacterium]